MAKNDFEQTQLIEAISFFKDIKRQSTKTNAKIVEYLDRSERGLQDELFRFLNQRINKNKKKGGQVITPGASRP